MAIAGMEPWPWPLQVWRSLCRRRHGAMDMAIAGMEPWPWPLQAWRSLCRRRHGAMAVATAGIEISVMRQHCREKTGSEIYLLSFFSLIK